MIISYLCIVIKKVTSAATLKVKPTKKVIMKTINFNDYAFNAIKESINATDIQGAVSYYGSPSECTIESYFGSQISDGKVYDSFEEHTEDEYIGSIEDLREAFEEARKEAFKNWLENLEEESDLTYDIRFADDSDSNSKGFKCSLSFCINYVETYNGTSESYFADYKGGTVSIVCNETGEEVYATTIR